MRTFRVATFNIWSRFGPWEERLAAIRTGLSAISADVVGLQEVHLFQGFDQAAIVSEGLGYERVWGKGSENHGFPVGNALLSRWPVLRSEVLPLPDGRSDERRCLVFAEIDAPFGKLPFFTTHLNWKLDDGRVRVLQVKAIVEAVTRLAPASAFPPILTGDFNAEPDADEMRYLRGMTGLGGDCVYFADAFHVAGTGEGATYSKTNPFAEMLREPERRIDYIYARPDDALRGEPLAARRCFDQPIDGTFASDHYGVVATITAGR